MNTNVATRIRPRGRLSAEQLQDRLITFGADTCVAMNGAARDFATTHIVHQLIRSATGVGSNYSEARSAPTPRDFLHKMHTCLKEARETMYWLKVLQRLSKPNNTWASLETECDELVAIFVASIETKKRNSSTQDQ